MLDKDKQLTIEDVQDDLEYRTKLLYEQIIDIKEELADANRTISILVHLLADKHLDDTNK